jgi:oligoribonuclease (3'-5' exoribonuclease)
VKYLSIDLEATGLAENDKIIEFAAIAFDSDERTIENELSFHCFVKCESFDELKPNLDKWVIEHNKELIDKAHSTGLEMNIFKEKFTQFLESKPIKEYFKDQKSSKIILFGKSMNAIDIPFLNRDLGWDFMNQYFHHRVCDLSCFSIGLIDAKLLEEGMDSGDKMMKFFKMGDVQHTALEDAINTAKLYFKVLDHIKS